MEGINWFIDPIKNHYFDFEGRASRQQFWMFTLSTWLFAVALFLIEKVLHTEMLNNLFGLLTFIPATAIGARRLHDIGRSGWWQLILLVPVIGLILLIVWEVGEGDVGANAYGQDPLDTANVAPTNSMETPISDIPPAPPIV